MKTFKKIMDLIRIYLSIKIKLMFNAKVTKVTDN